MVSLPVPPPVVQLVEEAVAFQEALSAARSSVTVTGPTVPEMVVPGAPLPRSAVAGAVSDRAPVVTVKVTMVFGSLPDGEPAEEYASTAGRRTVADAAPGYSAIPTTTAADRMRNADVNIDPPIKPGVVRP